MQKKIIKLVVFLCMVLCAILIIFFMSEEPKKEEVAQEEDFHYRYMDSDEDDDAMAHYEAFLIGKESAYAEDKEFDIISNQHVSLISTMPHDILIMIRMGTER